MKTFKTIVRLILLTTLTGLLSSFSAWASTVNYNDLRLIVLENNSSLDSINENLENIQYQISEFSSARADIKELQKKAEDDGDTASALIYEKNADDLNDSIVNLKNSYTKQLKVRSSLDKALNQLEKTAQTSFITYNKTLLNQQAAQKNYDAAVAKYNTMLNKYSVGVSNESDLLNASNNMLLYQNLLESYNQQLKSARQSLFKTLGLADDGSVTIGEAPDPNLASINAIDYANDRIVFVGYSNEVKSARSIKSDKFYYDTAQSTAEGDANAEFDDLCNQLKAEVLNYTASSQAYDAASKTFDTKKHKYQLGMLTEADYKQAEATYYDAYAKFKNEAMQLLQKYEDYNWTLYGL